ncbi:hypothetical protein D3C72_2341990 [compost metagenome]
MPGATSEKAQAASITPAPKPNMLSCAFCGMVRAKRMGSVPSPVAPAATRPPSRASATCGARTSRKTQSWYRARQDTMTASVQTLMLVAAGRTR